MVGISPSNSEALIGALDQGTTSSRFALVNKAGRFVHIFQREHQQYFPQPGWVEHDPREIWDTCQKLIGEALPTSGSSLSALGITNQRETVVAWDRRSGQPFYNAIVWQDLRAADLLKGLLTEDKEYITYTTGLTISPYFSAGKMKWLLANIPEVKDAAENGYLCLGTIDSWLVWNLTGGIDGGVHVTDVTNASRTMLMNLDLCEWDERLLSLFGVPRDALPTICSSSEIYGHISSLNGSRIKEQIPIAAILGDQQAAMVGQACFNAGDIKTTYGTGNFALLNTGTTAIRSEKGLLTTVCYKFGSEDVHFALEGSVANTGAAVQWLRDQLGIISQSVDVESLAQEVPDNGGVYFVPAFAGLYAPYWRDDARGVIVGLTRGSTKNHIARATLEAIAYQTRDVIDVMISDTGINVSAMKVDGGITANNLCMQIQADVLQLDISRPVNSETTALGAAYAAGLAVGVWSDTDEIAGLWNEGQRWRAHEQSPLAGEGYDLWKEAVKRTFSKA